MKRQEKEIKKIGGIIFSVFIGFSFPGKFMTTLNFRFLLTGGKRFYLAYCEWESQIQSIGF